MEYLFKKGLKMNVQTDKKLLKEAISSGCKTAAELARYLKMRTNMQKLYGSL